MLTLRKAIKPKLTKPRKSVPFKIGTILTIDPGLSGTGWAVWEAGSWEKLEKPIDSGSFSIPNALKDTPWYERADRLCDEIRTPYYKHCVRCCFIEQPEYMPSGVGLTAAGRGDLVKLTMLAGMLVSRVFINRATSPWFPVPVSEWKGQLKKEVCFERIKSLIKIDIRTKTTHELDAIGLGLYCKGFF